MNRSSVKQCKPNGNGHQSYKTSSLYSHRIQLFFMPKWEMLTWLGQRESSTKIQFQKKMFRCRLLNYEINVEITLYYTVLFQSMREKSTPRSWQFERRHLVTHSPSVMVQTVENKPQADKLHNNGIWQKWDIRPSWKHLMLHTLHFSTFKANIWLQQGDSQAASGGQLHAFAHLSGSHLIPNDTNH